MLTPNFYDNRNDYSPVQSGTYYPQTIDAHIMAKTQLRSRLESGKLVNMPAGFPFHYVFDGHGSAILSYDSFEFAEELCIVSSPVSPSFHPHSLAMDPVGMSGSMRCAGHEPLRSPTTSQKQTAIISHKCPGRLPACVRRSSITGTGNETRYLSWDVSLPSLDDFYLNTRIPNRVSIAHVQVDEAVMQTPYGKCIYTDPRIILRALAISIEFGKLIRIQMAKVKSTESNVYFGTCMKTDLYGKGKHDRSSAHHKQSPGTVEFVGVSNDGHIEVLHTVEAGPSRRAETCTT